MKADEHTEVDEELVSDIRQMAQEHEDDAKADLPEGSVQRLFWEEQKRAPGLKDSRSMKWHPLFIRWCMYLRHVSGKAYELLRHTPPHQPNATTKRTPQQED